MFRPTLILMSGRVISFVATFFIPIVLVRLFAPGEFGTYKQVFLLYGTLFGIAQIGMAESLFYFLPREPQRAGRYVLNSMVVLLMSGTVLLGVLTIERFRIAALLSNPSLAPYIPLLGIYLLLMVASAKLEIVMISGKKYGRASMTYALSEILRAGFMIVPALLLRDLSGLLLGALAFAIIRFGAALFYFHREFGDELRFDAGLIRQQFAYALPFEVAILVDALQANFHQYAVSHYFNAVTFAIYSVGCLQIPLIDFLASPAANVMMVHMSEEIREGRSYAVANIWNETTRKLALVFFPLFGLLVVTARDLIVFLFTNTYAASVPIFMVWSSIVLLSILQTDGVLRVYAETRLILVINIARLLFIAALIYVCVSAFGLQGAVLVTIGASALGRIIAMVRMKKQMQVGLGELLPWRSLAGIGAVTVTAGVVAFAVGSQMQTPLFIRLAVVGSVFTAAYLVLLFRFGLLNPGERSFLTNWVQRFAPYPSGAKEV